MNCKRKIEICANSVESALKAQEGGAFRVELCAGIPEGGTTPSYGDILVARKMLTSTKLHVIIRPRGGDFLYSQLEKEIMLNDIRTAKSIGVDGVVIGCLTKEGKIDKVMMKELIDEAGDIDVTFHRAFDMCNDPFEAMEDIISLGCSRILTSGLESSAEKGVNLLRDLVEKAKEQIIIMPGCGINSENIFNIATITKATEFHFSGRSPIDSQMEYRNSKVTMGGVVKIEEYKRDITNPQKIKDAILELNRID